MIPLTIFWSYIKKYWQIALALAIFIIGSIVFKTRSDSLVEMLEAAQKRHDDELDAIKKAHEKELAEKEAALKKMQETLAAIELSYQEAQKELDDKKRKEIQQIIKETQDDPDELARRLQESTGFKIDVTSK
jgi:anion-transporting  ArsA/GET3 family ATPase